MLEVLTRNRWWLLVRGIVALGFGILALVWPGMTPLGLAALYGAYALADGVAVLMLVPKVSRQTGAKVGPLVLVGVLGVGSGMSAFYWVGVSAFLWPGRTVLGAFILIATWAIARGIFEIAAALRLRKEMEGEWLLGLAGMLAIVVGIALLLQPGLGLPTLFGLAGFYGISAAALYIALGLRLGAFERRFRQASGA